MKPTIDGEQTYPIYTFTANWHQLRGVNEVTLPDGWSVGLSPDRFWNGTSWSRMFREERPIRELQLELLAWWEKYRTEKLSGKDTSVPLLHVGLKEFEVWHLTWFSHETFDIGQSNTDALASFERYVQRKERLPNPCLMGAEDRWRWCGSEPDGKPSHDSPPPCRCEHCKRAGLIRIGH